MIQAWVSRPSVWVTVAPTAQVLPYEIDNKRSWLEGLDPDKDPPFLVFLKFNLNFFISLLFFPEVSCHCGFDTYSPRASGFHFTPLRATPHPSFLCSTSWLWCWGRALCPLWMHVTFSPGMPCSPISGYLSQTREFQLKPY